jgi:hypothetical protein
MGAARGISVSAQCRHALSSPTSWAGVDAARRNLDEQVHAGTSGYSSFNPRPRERAMSTAGIHEVDPPMSINLSRQRWWLSWRISMKPTSLMTPTASGLSGDVTTRSERGPINWIRLRQRRLSLTHKHAVRPASKDGYLLASIQAGRYIHSQKDVQVSTPARQAQASIRAVHVASIRKRKRAVH